ncbi:MAG: helix-turn-helix domain-containing protein [Vicinamibacterales bacterium]
MNDPRRVEAALAANLREWRARRGWSQSELAARAGLSKAMLVQVEQAQTNPSIATLCKLANALGVALVKLVETADEPVVRRVAPADVAWLWRGRGAASRAGLVAGVEAPMPVELWDWRIGARDGYDAVAHPAGTREFVYVLDGAAAVTVDGVEVKLAAGECAVFQADRPHRYASAGGRATRFVMVVIEPIAPPADRAPRAGRGPRRVSGRRPSGSSRPRPA